MRSKLLATAEYHQQLFHSFPSSVAVVQKLFEDLDQKGVFKR